MGQAVQYLGDTTGSGPSPNIWGDCPWAAIRADPNKGISMFDDFHTYGLRAETLTTVVDVTQGYVAFGSSGATITNDGSLNGAVVLTEATADESVALSTEAHAYNMTQNGGALWFEARIKTSTITTAEQNFFVGLMDTTALAVAVPMQVGGALTAAMDCIGFLRPELDLTTVNCVYQAGSVSPVEVNSDVGTLAVGTYIKLGFKFVPSYKGAAKLIYFVDNVQQATTKTVPNATGTDFPADVTLGPVCAMMMGGTSSAETLTMDWWRLAQLKV